MNNFKRAKSDENKKIRFKEIMKVTDDLFHEYSYHEFGLTEISKKANIVRSGLYKYVTSKEEIFLEIYLEKQVQTISAMLHDMSIKKHTIEQIALCISHHFYNHLDYLKYHQILNAIIETNVSVEKLAEFKLRSANDRKPFFALIREIVNLENTEQAFDLYLTILYHSVYLYDRIVNRQKYVEAMKLANLKITTINFEKELYEFTTMCLTYHKQKKSIDIV